MSMSQHNHLDYKSRSYKLSMLKVKLSLCLINYAPHHSGEWGNEEIAPPFLASALDGAQWQASRPSRFTPAENAPSAHLIRDWVGPRAGLDATEKKKMTCPCRESKPGSPARSNSLHRLS
jgi:hypothetical protein